MIEHRLIVVAVRTMEFLGDHMKRRGIKVAHAAVALSGLLVVFVAPAAHPVPAPIVDAIAAQRLAADLGPHDTAGVYYRNNRPVIAVTNATAAHAVRSAGGLPEVVEHSTAELQAAHADLDKLAGIPNTVWGIDSPSNSVTVELYDGVSLEDRSRIEETIKEHGNAIRIEEHSGVLEESATYYMRGGLGISNGNRICSAAFNVENRAGKKFLLSAGHCVVGGYDHWWRRTGQVYLGPVHEWGYEPEDYAFIEYKNSDVVAVGSLQLRNESEQSITTSRDPVTGESVKRVGTMSQDLVGKVIRTSTTVTYTTGATLYNMIESDLCNVGGDSGGALYSGTSALGITSGGNHLDKPCSDSDAEVGRRSFYQNVQRLVSREGYEVY
ncbi:S1 family peptidase [Strepomyces sp. STD 3.1]|nr:S1 family peptidase [Streptomyces sp. STD 3.1]